MAATSILKNPKPYFLSIKSLFQYIDEFDLQIKISLVKNEVESCQI